MNKDDTKIREEIIKQITGLYISLIRSDDVIDESETDVLFNLLENLFRQEDISWEVFIREMSQKELDLPKILNFLNRHLITLDKIRILISLIALANVNNTFSSTDVTQILELSKKLNLETEGFMAIIDAIEYSKTEPVSIRGFRYFHHTRKSLFHDYLIIGPDGESDLRFRSSDVKDKELLVVTIDKLIFIGTSNNSSAFINDQPLKGSRLYLLPPKGHLNVGKVSFSAEHLQKMMDSRNSYDIISFSTTSYKFKIINDKNQYSLIQQYSCVSVNNERLPINREVPLYFDDSICIDNYDPFLLTDVIQHRDDIGAKPVTPGKMYIGFDDNMFYMSAEDKGKTIAWIQSQAGDYYIYPKRKRWDFYVNKKKITDSAKFVLNNDIITINQRNFRINQFLDLIEIPFEVQEYSILDLKHYFPDGDLALDNCSFAMAKGDLVGILGQSGCGKSTLLKTIIGEITPTYGSITLDGKDYFKNINYFSQFVGFVPQEDLLYPELTVYENLYFRGKLLLPRISKENLRQKIGNILMEMNLQHRKHSIVGNAENKLLSGGERKRLNIALELLTEPTILICDEPTSGLSSIDSVQVIELLKKLCNQGKIIILSIHQPNTDILMTFSKILLMDQGGKQVYYGSPEEAFDYFKTEIDSLTKRKEIIRKKKRQQIPDFFYELIEYPFYDENGEIRYIQKNDTLMVKRLFTPVYWRDKFRRKTLFDLISVDSSNPNKEVSSGRIKRKKLGVYNLSRLLWAYLGKNFLLKFRNRSNNLITFLEAPLLGFLISFILRLAPENDSYSYAENINMGIYIFISIIVFIFMGLSNSIEEILGERRMFIREKMLQTRISYHLFSKFTALTVYTIVQALLYLGVSVLILEIRGVFLINFLYLLVAGSIGYSIGMLISSFINSRKAIINVLPLILIPQIIFGGAIIEYERMNRRLQVVKTNPVPEVVEIIPSRWLFEGLYTAYSKKNPFEYNLAVLNKKRLTLRESYENGIISKSEYTKAKQDIVTEKNNFGKKYNKKKYVNRYLNLSVDMMDGKYLNSGKNVFLSSYKYYFNRSFRTYSFNVLVTLLYVALLNILTYIKLKYYYKD